MDYINNSFNIRATCDRLISIQSIHDLETLPAQKTMCLGGCSNVLFTQHYPGTILKNEIKGIQIIKDDEDFAWVEIGGGEVWHDLVLWSINQGLGGLENLSLIPGSVGAAPIQNIGAYGVELADVMEKLIGYDLINQEIKEYQRAECQFGYRTSLFKRDLKNTFFISRVVVKLTKRNHNFNTSYGAIQRELDEDQSTLDKLNKICRAVIRIRESKLPDPKELGNCGSFFKNPIIDRHMAERIAEDYDDLHTYPVDRNLVKIPAAWLIEKAGWKGIRSGDVGTYRKHALVLVNYGQATGDEIWIFAHEIIDSIKKKFRIELIPEVNVV